MEQFPLDGRVHLFYHSHLTVGSTSVWPRQRRTHANDFASYIVSHGDGAVGEIPFLHSDSPCVLFCTIVLHYVVDKACKGIIMKTELIIELANQNDGVVTSSMVDRANTNGSLLRYLLRR